VIMILGKKTNLIVQAMRPYNWTKNLFVYAPLIFSGKFTQTASCIKATLAFICFCIAASTVYLINDVCDRKEDSRHPVKKNRPIASGAIASKQAIIIGIILVICCLSFTYFLGGYVFICLLLYIFISIAYSLAIKHIVILDVLTIAFGFVLRVLAGSATISVEPSYWLVLCTIMISIFLGFAKRRAELVDVTNGHNNSRPVLKNYSIAFLDQVIPVVTGATILAYALYTVDEHTRKVLGTTAMFLTLPFVIYGLLRYIYIIYHLRKGADPAETLISDAPTVINLFLWVLTSLVIVKYADRIHLFH
jgi:4-hydroxybenzoate polyprenyltransferase